MDGAETTGRGHTMTDRAEQVGQQGQTLEAVDGVQPIALVDGSNVAHSSEGDEARLQNIKLVVKKLISEGYEPVVVADAALRHQIDDKEGYERRVEEGKIKQAPAGTDADYFLLAFARELDAVIVSNDLFRDRAESFPEARERMIRYMIVDEQVVFERRNKKR
jgi:hypothetical protein